MCFTEEIPSNCALQRSQTELFYLACLTLKFFIRGYFRMSLPLFTFRRDDYAGPLGRRLQELELEQGAESSNAVRTIPLFSFRRMITEVFPLSSQR
jgi:hypothetical protein